MDKKEILSLIETKSSRLEYRPGQGYAVYRSMKPTFSPPSPVIDTRYETRYPDQCSVIYIDGRKQNYFKCSKCRLNACLISFGPRNQDSMIKRHLKSAHKIILDSG